MSEKAGEIARESSDYRCEQCHQVTRIAQGELIPPVHNAVMAPMTFPIRVSSAGMAPWARMSRVEQGRQVRLKQPVTETISHFQPPDIMIKPRSDLVPNTADYENQPLVTANGFREYDARWLFGKEINLLGIQALGLGLGHLSA